MNQNEFKESEGYKDALERIKNVKEGESLMEPNTRYYQPQYADEHGNRFIFFHAEELFTDEAEARKYADGGGAQAGSMVGTLVFALNGLEVAAELYSFETDENRIAPGAHFTASMGPMQAGLISGPDFDELMKAVEEPGYKPNLVGGRASKDEAAPQAGVEHGQSSPTLH